jgi:KDEL-tailed cysteine endopeptidase
MRYNIFLKNLDIINNNNIYNHEYKMSINEFSDMTNYEYSMKYLGLNRFKRKLENLMLNFCRYDEHAYNGDVPEEVDWVERGKVSGVKNQKQCGSCWAFSAIGAVESAHSIKYGRLIEFSEQELVDCAKDRYGNFGCDGGLMVNAFHYMISNGVCEEVDYTYLAREDECRDCNMRHHMRGCRMVDSRNETALKYAVANQPLSVAIDASSSSFQFYSSGVLDASCGTDLNHGVLLVGYGEENGVKYWKIKNSWGETWGDKGYIKIKRLESDKLTDGMCGVALMPSYPIV